MRVPRPSLGPRLYLILARGLLPGVALLAGCAPKAAVKVDPFVAKPEVCPAAVRSIDQVLTSYVGRTSPESAEAWTSLVSQAQPEWKAGLADERPVPGTPWYEYLRCGQDFCSKMDLVLTAEYEKFRAQTEVADRNSALRHLLAGSMAYELGRLQEARKQLRAAVYWMEEVTSQELEQRAIVGRSDEKIYKGDSYERVMVHFYLGLIAYQLGDLPEARREFHRAVQADESKPAVEQRGKFALLHYWLGKTYARLQDEGNARVAMLKARESGDAKDAEEHFQLDRIRQDNLTLLIQIGSGPVRVLKGADWQQAEYKPTDYVERSCEVFIDGQHAGRAQLMADMWYHASTQGLSEEQKIQNSKAAAKAVLQAMPYVNLLAVGWDVRGDIRSWALLPGQILIWSGSVAPGEHVVTVKFYDAQDYELTRYRQTWYFVPAGSEQDTLVVLRSARDKCNMHGKEQP